MSKKQVSVYVYATYCYKLHQNCDSDIFPLKIGIPDKNNLFATLVLTHQVLLNLKYRLANHFPTQLPVIVSSKKIVVRSQQGLVSNNCYANCVKDNQGKHLVCVCSCIVLMFYPQLRLLSLSIFAMLLSPEQNKTE